MHPFFHVFGYRIPAFAVMMLAAALVTYLLVYLLTRKTPLWQDASNYYFFTLAGALGGAYLLNVALTLPAALSRWDALIKRYPLTEALNLLIQSVSGLIFYGGLIGGGLMMLLYSRVFKTPLLPYLDVFASVAPVTHAIGRVGCFLSGCCYGVPLPNSHPLSVIYPPESLAAPFGVPLLAAPLLEAGINLILAVGLFVYKKRLQPKAGMTAAVYICCYAVIRFVLEFWRGDLARGVWWGVSTSQIISVGVLAVGVGMAVRLKTSKAVSV
jgi:phosphatidylglycerol:prolipoprotein diacylglycerol transferase